MDEIAIKEESPAIGGHDYFFLEEPPSDVICPICRLVAREPQQVSCCGKIYCKSCFVELETQSKWSLRCANCREEEPEYFPDRKTAGQINSLRVACTKREEGCIWRGALREMGRHLSRCEYADMSCPFNCFGCNVRPLRKDLEEHVDSDLHNHLNLARNKIVEMERLVQEDRQLQEDKVHDAVTVLKESLQVQKKEMKKQLEKRIETHESNLRAKLNSLKQDILLETRRLPMVFKLSNFSDLKEDDEDWHSPSFFSHIGGYKMCLRVYTNGCSEVRGTHVSLYVYLMKSENDHLLEWPFRGTIHIDILNQLEDNQHYIERITFNSRELKNYNSRVRASSNMGVTGLGKSKFISQDDLGYNASSNCQYLKDDCLYFRVTKVDLQSMTRPWLACVEEEN